MERSNGVKQSIITAEWTQQIVDFGLLVKFKLTLLVIFSAVMSYAIAAGDQYSWGKMIQLAIGGFLITGAANALNQVLEREYDRLMPRTMNRPLATGRMGVSQAVLSAGLMALAGVTMLTLLSPLAGFLGTLSLISYAFVYTPMKRGSAMSVVVGAIPGALPLIIGPVVFDGFVTPAALMLFSIQFFWQFPHFWAVAWLADEDYKRAGFYMLPTPGGEKSPTVGALSLVFCLLLIGNTLMGWYSGLTGPVATILLVALNAWFAYTGWRLYRDCSREAARRQMFTSFLHLPFSLIVILIDRVV